MRGIFSSSTWMVRHGAVSFQGLRAIACGGFLSLFSFFLFPLCVPAAFTVEPAAPIQVGSLGLSGNTAHTEAVRSFCGTLAAMAAPGKTILNAPGNATRSVAPEDLTDAARELMRREDLNVILVSDSDALRALAAADNGRVAILALGPDCVPSALDAAALRPGMYLFDPRFLQERLGTLRRLIGFSRLGYIGTPPDAARSERERAAAIAEAANNVGGELEVFGYTDLNEADEAGCREAVDSLFFDEVDALLLDASGCFDPSRPDFAELTALLRSRGILPLSLTEFDGAEKSALVAPWAGNSSVLGREAALFFRMLPEIGTKFAGIFHDRIASTVVSSDAERLFFTPTGDLFYVLNLKTAEAMGFDPPVALLALTKAFAGESPAVPSGGGRPQEP